MQLFKENSTGQSFWETLLSDSENLSKEAMYPKSLSPSFDWELMFKEFFTAFHYNKKVQEAVKTRLFVGSRKSPELIHKIAEKPPNATESLETWGESLFEGLPWCIVLDKISGCIDDLSTEVATWMSPYFQTLDPGSFSTDISPYVGRYGYTPFGAHLDIDGISVLHLHMGPGIKEMTIWPEDEFRHITGSNALNCYDFEPYLKHGKTYTIEPGDIFHLPASTYYHIARADAFSVGITIGLKHENAQSMLKKAMNTFQKDPNKSDIKTALEQFKWRRNSNCGFMKPPLIRSMDLPWQETYRFKRIVPFPIHLGLSSEGKTMAFARGRRIPGYLSPDQVDLIEQLNQDHPISFSQIASSKSLVSLTEQLYSFKAITEVM